MLPVCVIAREDNNLNCSHRPHRVLDGSEDDIVNSHFLNLTVSMKNKMTVLVTPVM